MRRRLLRALDKGREGKKLFVVGNSPVDLTAAFDRLAKSSAQFGVVGVMGKLQVEDPREQAHEQASSKAVG